MIVSALDSKGSSFGTHKTTAVQERAKASATTKIKKSTRKSSATADDIFSVSNGTGARELSRTTRETLKESGRAAQESRKESASMTEYVSTVERQAILHPLLTVSSDMVDAPESAKVSDIRL